MPNIINHSAGVENFEQVIENISQYVKKIQIISAFEISFAINLFGSNNKYIFVNKNNATEYICNNFPIIDFGDKIGSIKVTTSSPLNDENKVFLESLALVIALEFKNRWTNNLVNSLIEPISLELDVFEYNKKLAETICDASGAKHIFIRKHKVSSFDCVAYYCREKPKDDLSAEANSITYETNAILYNYLENFIKNAEENHFFSISQITKNDEEFSYITTLIADNEIDMAITVPLTTASKCTGIVSLVFDVNIPISKTVKDGFFLVANHAAIALEHYEKNRYSNEVRDKKIRLFLDHANFDILQGFRHSAFNNLGLVKGELIRLKKQVESENKNFELSDAINKIDFHLSKGIADLESMRTLTSRIEHCKKLVNLKECFIEAQIMLKQILDQHNIAVHKPDKNIYIWGHGDAIKYAFYNMMYNSYQSLIQLKKSEEKKITLAIAYDQNDRVSLRLSDNGVGFIPKKNTSINDIWEIGATTKDNGTGYGLAMVRDIFQNMHQGSCRVIDRKNGFCIGLDIFKYSNKELEELNEEARQKFGINRLRYRNE